MHKHVPFVFFFRFLFVTCVVFWVFGFSHLCCWLLALFLGVFFFSSPLVAGSCVCVCVRACVAVCFFFCAPWLYLLSWDDDDLDRAFACLKTGFGGDPFCSVLAEGCLIFFLFAFVGPGETNKKPRVFLTIT
jgi:hypothetical protein